MKLKRYSLTALNQYVLNTVSLTHVMPEGFLFHGDLQEKHEAYYREYTFHVPSACVPIYAELIHVSKCQDLIQFKAMSLDFRSLTPTSCITLSRSRSLLTGSEVKKHACTDSKFVSISKGVWEQSVIVSELPRFFKRVLYKDTGINPAFFLADLEHYTCHNMWMYQNEQSFLNVYDDIFDTSKTFEQHLYSTSELILNRNIKLCLNYSTNLA